MEPQRIVTIPIAMREGTRRRERERVSVRYIMHGDSQKLKLYDYFDIVPHKFKWQLFESVFILTISNYTPADTLECVCVSRNCMNTEKKKFSGKNRYSRR